MPVPTLRRLLTLVAIVATAAILAVCTDAATGPDRQRGTTAHLAFAPQVAPEATVALQAAGVEIDNVRLVIRRETGEIVLDTVVAFPAGADEVQLVASVPVAGVSETMAATIQLRRGTEVLFEGVQTLDVKPGAATTPPAAVVVDYVGPGATATRVEITPPDAALGPNESRQLNATAFGPDNQPIANAIFAWTTSAADVAAVSASGLVTTGQIRGSATITARVPTGVSGTGTVNVSLPPSQLRVVSGGSQTGVLGKALAQLLVVEVVASDGVPVPGVEVSFRALTENAAASPAAVVTDALGRASTTLTLAATLGAQSFEASATGIPPVVVSAVATIGTGRVVTIVDGNEQSALTGAALAVPLTVRVTDEFGNPVAGETVTWTRTSGTGTLAAETSVTDADGRATVAFTAGTAAGAVSITAAVGESVVTFAATTALRTPSALIAVSPLGQEGVVGSAIARVVARVRDAGGFPAAGAVVTWLAVGPAVLSATSSVADENGEVFVDGVFADQIGSGTITARIANGTALDFHFIAVAGPPHALVVVAGDAQNAIAGTTVATPPTVRVVDALGNPIEGVSVVFEVTSGGGSLTGATATTDAEGVASPEAWLLGLMPGPNTVTATVGDLEPVVFTALGLPSVIPAFITLFDGDEQTATAGTAVAIAPAVKVWDDTETPIAGVVVTFSVTGGGGILIGGTAISDANGVARVGSWILGPTPGVNTLLATVGEVEPVEFTATGTAVSESITLALTGGRTFVGVTFSTQVQVTLNVPAPAGGVVVSLGSSDPSRLSVTEPGTVLIPEGTTQGLIGVHGVAAGSATLTATAPGYAPGVLLVPVSLRLINLPVSVNVPYGATASVPIQLAEAAPVGGVTVSVTSSVPSLVTVLTPTVNFAAGATLANATIAGTFPGSATLSATATDYIPGATTATTAANLNIVETTVNLNASFGSTFTVRLQSAGVPIAAPAGGLEVTLAVVNAACVTVPASVTIPAGLTQVLVAATYGGSATLPCSTQVTASAPNIDSDVVTLNVALAPTISLSVGSVGVGLQRQQSIFLNSSVHSGVTVQLASADPSRVLLAPNANTPGAATLDVSIAAGVTSASFFVQGIGGTGSALITPSAPGFTGTAALQNVVVAWLDVINTPAAMTTLTADAPFVVRVGIGSATSLSELQSVRAGAPPLDVTVTVADDGVFRLVTTDGESGMAALQIQPQANSTPGTVAAGGVAIRPVAAGSTSLTAASSDASSTSNATRTTTVSAPGFTISASSVGAGLQRLQTVTLGVATHGGTTVRVESTDPARMLVAPNASTVGTAFIDVPLLNGVSSFNFVAQVIEGASGSVPVEASAPSFTLQSTAIPIVQAAIDLINVPATTTLVSNDAPITVRSGIGSASSLSELQAARFGGPGLAIDVASSDQEVLGLVTTEGVQGEATVVIAPGASSSPGTVAGGGVAVRPSSAGSATVTASGAGLVTTTNAIRNVTVTGGTISLSVSTVGSGLQRSGSGSLSGGNHGGVVVRLTSADPTTLLIAPNASTAGSAFIDIPVANGATAFSYVVQALEGKTGSITVTATSPLFADGTANASVVQGALDIVNLPAATTTLTADAAFTVRVGIGSAGSLSELQNVRAGAAPLVATVQSSTVAGQLVTTLATGASVTVSIAAGASSSPGTVAGGGAAFRPFTAGTTVVSATIPGFTSTTNASRSVTVSAPSISMTAATVGAGLMRSTSGSLSDAQHGGVTLRIASSNPAVALVSPNTSTAGTPFIDLVLGNGTSFFSFIVHGIEDANATVQITAVAPGFTDGSTTATVTTPRFDLSGILIAQNTASVLDPFTVRVGIGSATSLSELQAVRTGASPLTATITSTNPAAVGLVTTDVSGAVVQVSIGAGASSSPGTVAAGGAALDALAPGTSTISATIPGFSATANASHIVTVSPASITVTAMTIGSGLQRSGTVTLSGADHGGVTVRLTSADPARLLVSPNASTAGSAFIDVVVPGGSTSFSFVAQALEDVTGTVLFTATAPGFVDGTASEIVVQSAMDISGLATAANAGGADDPFTIRVGIPNALNTALAELQAVRAGATAVTATVTSTNAVVGTLVTTALTAGSVTVPIAPQASSSAASVAAGGVAFRPLSGGAVNVAVTIPGYRVLPTSTVTVTVAN